MPDICQTCEAVYETVPADYEVTVTRLEDGKQSRKKICAGCLEGVFGLEDMG